MVIGVISHKGGVGKSTTALHCAAVLQRRGPTMLIDGDANRTALKWSRRGELPFRVADEKVAAASSRDIEHLVIDTEAHLSNLELSALIEQCDHLIAVCEPEITSLDALADLLDDLNKLGSKKHRVLITKVPPLSDARDARAIVEALNVKSFKHHIRLYAAYKRAAVEGTTVDKVRDDHAADGWQDYLKAIREIL